MTTMKKILTVLMLSILALSLTLSAFAADGAFVKSPSKNLAPELVEGGSEDHDCDEPLIITSYADRDKLSAELKAMIEKVYSEIRNAKNLIALCPALKELANERNIPTANLEVSDLFDISDACGYVEGKFDIVLKAETLENFVGLVHYNDGKYELIENAKIEEIDGEMHLKFSTDGLSPFAIVVDSGANLPVQNNNTAIAVLAIIAIAEGAVLVAILVKFILGKKFA